MNFALFSHFLRERFAQRDFALDRVEVQTLADVAVADGVYVGLAAGLDVGIILLLHDWSSEEVAGGGAGD